MIHLDTTRFDAPKPSNNMVAELPRSGEPSFGTFLTEATDNVRAALHQADLKASDALTGQTAPHEAMLALANADMQLRLFTQTRNKIVDAYQELMNIRM
ncbi:MAG: flagellar hook-basal body complex protein FliE [Myxococcota bacterium]